MAAADPTPRVFVTGAGGYLGRKVVVALGEALPSSATIVATDLRVPTAAARLPGVTYAALDVRDADVMMKLMEEHRPTVVVHLAAVLDQGGGPDARRVAYEVDVVGTQNVLEACRACNVGKIIVTSSGAAYGYHADNPARIPEDAPLRGNVAFAYSHHKRLIEDMLAKWREDVPTLKQLILRPGTILGAETSNLITAMFEKPVVMGLRGYATPIVFIWDEDVAQIIVKGVQEEALTGIYNLAGDGVMTLREIAHALGKRYVALPVNVVRLGLTALQKLGRPSYRPEQVVFLQYRPVLANDRLKSEFGFVPRSTRSTFDVWRQGREAAHGR